MDIYYNDILEKRVDKEIEIILDEIYQEAYQIAGMAMTRGGLKLASDGTQMFKSYIDQYYGSFTPVKYKRNGTLQHHNATPVFSYEEGAISNVSFTVNVAGGSYRYMDAAFVLEQQVMQGIRGVYTEQWGWVFNQGFNASYSGEFFSTDSNLSTALYNITSPWVGNEYTMAQIDPVISMGNWKWIK